MENSSQFSDFDTTAIAEIQQLAKKLGRTPSQRDYDKDDETTLCSRRIIRRFKKWNNFIEAAGLEKRRPGVYSPKTPRRQLAAQKKKLRIEQQNKAKIVLVEKAKKLQKQYEGKISKHSFAKRLGHDYRTIERWFDGCWDNFLSKLA